jgi:uncharacterized membrane protein YkgB
VIAAATMFVATFLPYIGWYGDGLLAVDEYPNQVTTTVIAGSDVWFVLGTVVTLGGAAVGHIAGFRRRFTGLLALAASLVAVGLAMKLPGTWLQDGVTYGTPYLVDAGFYVFVGGALMSVVGAVLMAAIGLAGSHSKAERPMSPLPS